VPAPISQSHDASADARDARIGQVLSDYLERRARGQAEPEEELLANHADLADELRLHLDMLRDLEPPGSKIAQPVSQEILEKSTDARYAAQLGPYKIVDYVGSGGMGIVLRAYEESLDRTVALKILRPELTADASALARFTREASPS